MLDQTTPVAAATDCPVVLIPTTFAMLGSRHGLRKTVTPEGLRYKDNRHVTSFAKYSGDLNAFAAAF